MAPPGIYYSVLKCTITSFKTKLIPQFNFDGMIYVARKDGQQVKITTRLRKVGTT